MLCEVALGYVHEQAERLAVCVVLQVVGGLHQSPAADEHSAWVKLDRSLEGLHDAVSSVRDRGLAQRVDQRVRLAVEAPTLRIVDLVLAVTVRAGREIQLRAAVVDKLAGRLQPLLIERLALGGRVAIGVP